MWWGESVVRNRRGIFLEVFWRDSGFYNELPTVDFSLHLVLRSMFFRENFKKTLLVTLPNEDCIGLVVFSEVFPRYLSIGVQNSSSSWTSTVSAVFCPVIHKKLQNYTFGDTSLIDSQGPSNFSLRYSRTILKLILRTLPQPCTWYNYSQRTSTKPLSLTYHNLLLQNFKTSIEISNELIPSTSA